MDIEYCSKHPVISGFRSPCRRSELLRSELGLELGMTLAPNSNRLYVLQSQIHAGKRHWMRCQPVKYDRRSRKLQEDQSETSPWLAVFGRGSTSLRAGRKICIWLSSAVPIMTQGSFLFQSKPEMRSVKPPCMKRLFIVSVLIVIYDSRM